MHLNRTLLSTSLHHHIHLRLLLLKPKPRPLKKLAPPISDATRSISTNSSTRNCYLSTLGRNDIASSGGQQLLLSSGSKQELTTYSCSRQQLTSSNVEDENLSARYGGRDEFGSVYHRSLQSLRSAKIPRRQSNQSRMTSLRSFSVPDFTEEQQEKEVNIETTDSDEAISSEACDLSEHDERTLKRMERVVSGSAWDEVEDDADDVYERKLDEARYKIGKRNVTVHTFALKLEKLIRQKKLQAALDMFFNQMLLVDRVRPSYFCYNILISGCGKYGYTKMAWKLFNDMKKRGYAPQDVTYTSLFNACANSLSLSDAEHVLKRLRRLIVEKNYKMNAINYQALIKAYGRCGYIQLAFGAADEMIEAGHPLTSDVINFLLQACISHREEGFKFALMVWQRMRRESLTPMVCTYNLILKSAITCKAGEIDQFVSSLKDVVPGFAARGTLTVQDSQQTQSTNNDAGFNPACGRKAVDPSALTTDKVIDLSSDKVIDPSSPTTDKAIEFSSDQLIDSSYSTTDEIINLSSSTTDEVIDPSRDEITAFYAKPVIDDAVDNNDDSEVIEFLSLTENSNKSQLSKTSQSDDPLPARSDGVTDLSASRYVSCLPDLLSGKPNIGSVLAIQHLKSMDSRMALLGSWRGVLSNMAADGLKPDIRTFSLLLHSLTGSDNHKDLMDRMEQHSIVPDTGFYNQLIMTGARRHWRVSAEEILSEMTGRGLKPDVITFGSLAWLVRSHHDLSRYLDLLATHDVRLSRQMLQTLLKRAFKRYDFDCVMKTLHTFVEHRIEPTRYTVEILEEFNENLKKLQLEKDRGEMPASKHLLSVVQRKGFDIMCERFRRRYHIWLRNSPLHQVPDPYEQFKVEPLVPPIEEKSN